MLLLSVHAMSFPRDGCSTNPDHTLNCGMQGGSSAVFLQKWDFAFAAPLCSSRSLQPDDMSETIGSGLRN